ncbi:hypothetical protein [Stratiformator vulcanicus]|uniref:Uncharacterized protein n=1 Tax=Stratiformator vulcanicus TaxID=2527980 RepID=A0A517QYF5_9PLAN|nr:hypothetical protein [Stratiformator vulcanicus]QDT36689.1 hypothetical protein Pan189_10510 [Stratiformator vulcanicus]
MPTIVADENLHETLRGVTERVEVRDASGKLLGQFTPIDPAFAKAIAEIDWDEIDRKKANPGAMYTFDEMWERIRQR